MKPRRYAPAWVRWVGLIMLLAYMGLLVHLILQERYSGNAAGVPLWELQDASRLLAWLGGFAQRAFFDFAFFVPLGFMVTLLLAGSLRARPRFLANFTALAVALVLAALVKSLGLGWPWYWADLAALVLPLLGCLLGVWMGRTCLRGWRARLWLIPKMVLLAALIAGCAGIVFLLLVEARPLSFAAAPVTSAEKRRLVDLIRSKSPRSLREGQTETLRLTEHDIDVLLSWGLSLGSPNRKARVSLNQDTARILVSVGVPLGKGRVRYLNLAVAGRVYAAPQTLTLHLDQCRLGPLDFPQRLLDALSPLISSELAHGRLSRPFVDATRDIRIHTGTLEVSYGRVHLQSHGFREGFFGSEVLSAETLAATRAQVNDLLAQVSQSPNLRPEFGRCLETVFAMARARSAESDPVIENRGAIFALGMLLGHRRFEEFLGSVRVGSQHYAAQRALRRVTLRGRSDWTKHFCLSAAICLLSDEVVSDAAGLLKEELDAGRGGSGFSFTDLLADQAGTTFATLAVRDTSTARALQSRLAHGFAVDDFFPEAADLPEGISDAELQSRYGGVGGQGYMRVMAEIERRIAGCAGYRVLGGLSP